MQVPGMVSVGGMNVMSPWVMSPGIIMSILLMDMSWLPPGP
jgi:hypothetical protein